MVLSSLDLFFCHFRANSETKVKQIEANLDYVSIVTVLLISNRTVIKFQVILGKLPVNSERIMGSLLSISTPDMDGVK